MEAVRQEIAKNGYWETYGEYRMGAGPTVRVTALGNGRGQSFRSTAVWGGLSMAGEYADLESALSGLETFGDAIFEVRNKGAWHGLIEQDLSVFGPELRSTARFTNGGKEVMWPREEIENVVNTLADQGMVVLGLDLRSDGAGATPSGLSTEVPWSAYRPDPASRAGEVEDARQQALEALHRPGLVEMDEYRWVLVTW
jgi:hypothetical protein